MVDSDGFGEDGDFDVDSADAFGAGLESCSGGNGCDAGDSPARKSISFVLPPINRGTCCNKQKKDESWTRRPRREIFQELLPSHGWLSLAMSNTTKIPVALALIGPGRS